MNLRSLTLHAAVLKVLADEIAARQMLVKAACAAAFTEAGASQAVPVLPDGTKVATVSLAGGDGKSASVTDDGAFLAWVKSRHPGEIEEAVRDSYKKKLLDGAKKAGRAYDPVTGEPVPGITIRDSQPYVSVRLKPGGHDAIADAWQAGELDAIDLVRPRAVEQGAA